MNARIVLTTAESKAQAQQIARALVERRLAACVNIVGPMESVYRWKDKVETAEEWLLLVKTTDRASSWVRDAIRQLHSYELPECIAVAAEGGDAEYLDWIGQNVD
jgi:periplasmic divalent cation tolerance protein